MFGFLRVHRCGLDEQQERLYRGCYCGGCHALRELGGLPATLLTSYDQAFLFAIAAALDPSAPSPALEWRACAAFPLRKVPVQPLSQGARRAVACVSVALVEAKLRDDVLDDRAWTRSLGLRLLAPRARQAEAALRAGGFPYSLLAGLPQRQQDVERRAEAAPPPTLDELSAPIAEVMAAVFAHVAHVHGLPGHQPALRALGEALGRYLYGWDAVVDAERDRRSGNFNALGVAFGEPWDRVRARAWLEQQLSAFEAALGRLPLGEHEAVARALVRSLRKRMHQALPVPRRAPDVLLPLVLRGRHAHERGDCDCDCSGCDCSACDCSGCEKCGDCGDAGECCNVCDCCCHTHHHRCCCPDIFCCDCGGGGSRRQPPPPPPPPPPGSSAHDPGGGARYPYSGPSRPEDGDSHAGPA